MPHVLRFSLDFQWKYTLIFKLFRSFTCSVVYFETVSPPRELCLGQLETWSVNLGHGCGWKTIHEITITMNDLSEWQGISVGISGEYGRIEAHAGTLYSISETERCWTSLTCNPKISSAISHHYWKYLTQSWKPRLPDEVTMAKQTRSHRVARGKEVPTIPPYMLWPCSSYSCWVHSVCDFTPTGVAGV